MNFVTVRSTVSRSAIRRGVRSAIFLVVAFAAGAVACGGSTPAPSAPSPAASASGKAPSSDPNRALSESECQSLGQWLAEACQTRPNERSARVDGWCGDLVRGVENGSWASRDCLKHIKYMDSQCLRSASNVHNMMDCDRSVERSE
jgi:hypothetical protein